MVRKGFREFRFPEPTLRFSYCPAKIARLKQVAAYMSSRGDDAGNPGTYAGGDALTYTTQTLLVGGDVGFKTHVNTAPASAAAAPASSLLNNIVLAAALCLPGVMLVKSPRARSLAKR